MVDEPASRDGQQPWQSEPFDAVVGSMPEEREDDLLDEVLGQLSVTTGQTAEMAVHLRRVLADQLLDRIDPPQLLHTSST